MSKVPLHELVADRGQASVAKALGVSAAAISKAIRAEREILVTVLGDGRLEAVEFRRFPAHLADAPKKSAA